MNREMENKNHKKDTYPRLKKVRKLLKHWQISSGDKKKRTTTHTQKTPVCDRGDTESKLGVLNI